MNIFKKINAEYKYTKTEIGIQGNSNEEYVMNLCDRMTLLQEVKSYILTYKWLKQKETIERAKYYMECRYNYESFCEHFDISYDAARSSISYICRKLEENIGEHLIELIHGGKIVEATALFRFKSGQAKVEDYLIDSALSLIPRAEFHNYSLEDCRDELRVLALYSRANLSRLKGMISPEKMEFLRFVLEGDYVGLSEERLQVVRILEREISVDALIKEREEKFL